MLQFNKEVDYAVQLLLALKTLPEGQLLSLRNFSKDSKISFLFLQRIAFKLKNAGIVKSVKGAQGGYCLAQKPQKITFKNVVDALEGECVVANCLRAGFCCEKQKTCKVHDVFSNINTKISEYLNNINLETISS